MVVNLAGPCVPLFGRNAEEVGAAEGIPPSKGEKKQARATGKEKQRNTLGQAVQSTKGPKVLIEGEWEATESLEGRLL